MVVLHASMNCYQEHREGKGQLRRERVSQCWQRGRAQVRPGAPQASSTRTILFLIQPISTASIHIYNDEFTSWTQKPHYSVHRGVRAQTRASTSERETLLILSGLVCGSVFSKAYLHQSVQTITCWSSTVLLFHLLLCFL